LSDARYGVDQEFPVIQQDPIIKTRVLWQSVSWGVTEFAGSPVPVGYKIAGAAPTERFHPPSK